MMYIIGMLEMGVFDFGVFGVLFGIMVVSVWVVVLMLVVEVVVVDQVYVMVVVVVSNVVLVLSFLVIMWSNGYFDVSEKLVVIKEWNVIVGEKLDIDLKVVVFGIIVEMVIYDNVFVVFGVYLSGLFLSWNDISIDMLIILVIDQVVWVVFYNVCQVLLNKIVVVVVVV